MQQINAHIDTNYKSQIKQRNNILKSIRELQKQGRQDRLRFLKREKPEWKAYYLKLLFSRSICCSGHGKEAKNTEDRGCGLEKPENFHQLGVARTIKLKQDT